MESRGYVYTLDDGGYVKEVMLLQQKQEEYQATGKFALDRIRNVSVGMSTMTSAMRSFHAGFAGFMGSLSILTGGVQGSDDTMRRIQNALMVTYGITVVYSFLASAIRTIVAVKTAQAVAETAIATAAQQWHAIALATAASAMVGGSFMVGYEFGSGEWHFTADISTPQGKREAASQLSSVRKERGYA